MLASMAPSISIPAKFSWPASPPAIYLNSSSRSGRKSKTTERYSSPNFNGERVADAAATGFCGTGGYLLGLITGLLGRSAIAATTVAVESVVLKHLEHQLITLGDRDPDATAAISAIVSEERQHHDQSEVHLEGHQRWRAVIEPVVSASTEAVIWLGMRL